MSKGSQRRNAVERGKLLSRMSHMYNIWLFCAPTPNLKKYEQHSKASDQSWGRIASPHSHSWGGTCSAAPPLPAPCMTLYNNLTFMYNDQQPQFGNYALSLTFSGSHCKYSVKWGNCERRLLTTWQNFYFFQPETDLFLSFLQHKNSAKMYQSYIMMCIMCKPRRMYVMNQKFACTWHIRTKNLAKCFEI